MYNPKFKVQNIKNTILFFILPFFALPAIIIDVLKNKKYAFLLLALFFALLSYIMVPYDTMDIVRHYDRFNQLKNMSIIEYAIVDSYYSLEYVILIIQYLGLPKEFLPFIYIFFIYSITFKILNKISLDKLIIKDRRVISNFIFMLFFLIFFISQLRLVGYSSGLRTGLANTIMLYGTFNLYYLKNNIKGYLYIFLSPLVHPSLLLVIPFIFMSKIKLYKFYKILFYISIIFFLTNYGTEILLFSINLIRPIVDSNMVMLIDTYIYGRWGINYWDEISGVSYIYEKIIKPLPLYVFIVYLLIVPKSTPLRNLIYLLFFIVSIFMEFRTLLDRYGDFLIQLTLLMLLIEYRDIILTKFKLIFLYVLLIVFLMIDVAGLRVYRDIIIPSWGKTIYLPSIGYFLSAPKEHEYIKSKG